MYKGYGDVATKKICEKVIALLLREGFCSKFQGSTEDLFVPDSGPTGSGEGDSGPDDAIKGRTLGQGLEDCRMRCRGATAHQGDAGVSVAKHSYLARTARRNNFRCGEIRWEWRRVGNLLSFRETAAL
jgi:hypothetical protein